MADSLSGDSWSGCSVHGHQYSLLLQFMFHLIQQPCHIIHCRYIGIKQ